jgi:hypothetical protein
LLETTSILAVFDILYRGEVVWHHGKFSASRMYGNLLVHAKYRGSEILHSTKGNRSRMLLLRLIRLVQQLLRSRGGSNPGLGARGLEPFVIFCGREKGLEPFSRGSSL